MSEPSNAAFGSTRWSIVLRARQRGTPDAEVALADLCRDYWYPIYAFIRRKGFDADRAADLTQGFFTLLLEKDALNGVDQSKGRFRSWLLACCQHFLSNETDRERALKRGGGRIIVSLDDADARYRCEPVDAQTAERLFERRWALELLTRVLIEVHDEYARAGKAELFDALKPLLSGSHDQCYRDLGEAQGMTEDAIKQAVRRLRQRYRERLRLEVAKTVEEPAQVEEEIRDLFVALSG